MTENMKDWVNRMAQLLRRPAQSSMQQIALEKAKLLIDQKFTQKRAQTCKSVLDGLLSLAKNGTIETMSQKEIGLRIGWSSTTVGYYIRRMEELHFLSRPKSIQRDRSGRFLPTTYYINHVFITSDWLSLNLALPWERKEHLQIYAS
jgi:hypothetical protein